LCYFYYLLLIVMWTFPIIIDFKLLFIKFHKKIVFKKDHIKLNNKQSTSVRIIKVSNNKILKLLSSHFPISISIDHMHVWCNISGSWLKALIHGSVTVNQPFSNFNSFTDSIIVSIISLNDFSMFDMMYLAKFLHSYLENKPPF